MITFLPKSNDVQQNNNKHLTKILQRVATALQLHKQFFLNVRKNITFKKSLKQLQLSNFYQLNSQKNSTCTPLQLPAAARRQPGVCRALASHADATPQAGTGPRAHGAPARLRSHW